MNLFTFSRNPTYYTIKKLAVFLLCISLGGCGKDKPVYVPQIAIGDLQQEIQQGKKVVFIDTREPREFAETHLPNAINLPVRSITSDLAQRYADADYVIPYCLKDFRGFETAKLLKRHGLTNVALLYPSGLKGWQSYWAKHNPASVIVKPNR